jgi:N-acetyl-gamma-glutamyl-phosphate reductase
VPGYELLEIEHSRRKDESARAELLRSADIAVLCLPDAAAREAVALVLKDQGTTNTRILDASTAFRVDEDWCYGLPELCATQRQTIRGARLVSNPGCYPQGVILALNPLRQAEWLAADAPISVHAVSGYSGGGNKLIAKLENLPQCDQPGWRVRPYALDLQHKHLPEMRRYSNLTQPPLFAPSVGAYYQGMLVSCALPVGLLPKGTHPDEVLSLLDECYCNEQFVNVMALAEAAPDGYLDPTACNDTNRIELIVSGSNGHILITARYDNLGKGAAGAAVQNLNLMCGYDEATGLAA